MAGGERTGVEEGEWRVGRRAPRHVLPGDLPHGVGVVFVLHADAGAERSGVEVRHVARGIDVRMTGAAELVDDDAILHQHPGPPRHPAPGLEAEASPDPVPERLRLTR